MSGGFYKRVGFIVKIVESPFVATNLFQDAQQSHSLLLECRSIPEHLPLEYCRFVLPDGTGFSINENSTSKKYVCLSFACLIGKSKR